MLQNEKTSMISSYAEVKKILGTVRLEVNHVVD